MNHLKIVNCYMIHSKVWLTKSFWLDTEVGSYTVRQHNEQMITRLNGDPELRSFDRSTTQY